MTSTYKLTFYVRVGLRKMQVWKALIFRGEITFYKEYLLECYQEHRAEIFMHISGKRI